jgi:fido (protein-threonine AMPylation protein)
MSDSTRLGDATSYDETARGILPRSELMEIEYSGIAKGLTFVLSQDETSSLPPELLLQLPRECFADIFPDWARVYRNVNVKTSSHQFPPFYQVPELVQRFFFDLNERLLHNPTPIALVA